MSHLERGPSLQPVAVYGLIHSAYWWQSDPDVIAQTAR